MDLSKKELPVKITVSGKQYRINTDYEFFLAMARKLKDKASTPADFDFMYKDESPSDKVAGLEALLSFMNPPRELPRPTPSDRRAEPVLDYDIDADLIYSAFYQQYKIDLFEVEHLHWWKFIALLLGLRDTKLTDVIGYRLYEPSGDKSEYSKNQQQMHDAWALHDDRENNEPDEALAEFEAFLDS